MQDIVHSPFRFSWDYIPFVMGCQSAYGNSAAIMCRLYNDVLQSTGFERQQAALQNPAQKKIANRDGL